MKRTKQNDMNQLINMLLLIPFSKTYADKIMHVYNLALNFLSNTYDFKAMRRDI